ncbi:hypothetical protein [Campylobacter sp. US33a]|uniref:hypothetical protein n=1 Tax=Campylobacter sp. US33a TaxID=2498120 RepID=UPI00106870F5|nr:hypothetical protein [Campylobacter sp. US33a]TEY00741.1 hypothetical protein ELQ16_08890 [Campylobacter sp. US33a]
MDTNILKRMEVENYGKEWFQTYDTLRVISLKMIEYNEEVITKNEIKDLADNLEILVLMLKSDAEKRNK